MKLFDAAAPFAALSLCVLASACSPSPTSDEAAAEAAPAEAAVQATPAAADAAAPAADAAAAPADSGAPVFAVLYPGAQAKGPAVAGDNGSATGGMVEFTTDASPEQVVAFYKTRAEAAGLNTMVAMAQGEAETYGAGSSSGAKLSVIASPAGDQTSVQLTWDAPKA